MLHQKNKNKDITMNKTYQIQKRLTEANANLEYTLIVFGDHLAHSGIDAVHFYICQTYHYLPSQVRSMSVDDLRFLLAEKMYDWTLPTEAKPQWCRSVSCYDFFVAIFFYWQKSQLNYFSIFIFSYAYRNFFIITFHSCYFI